MQNAKCKVQNQGAQRTEMRKAAGIHSKRYSLFQERNTRRPSLNAKSPFVLDFALCTLHFAFCILHIICTTLSLVCQPLLLILTKFLQNSSKSPLQIPESMLYYTRSRSRNGRLRWVKLSRIEYFPFCAPPCRPPHFRGGLIFCPQDHRPEAGRR